MAFVKGRGDLWIMDPDGHNAHRLLAHWNHPTYEWSPDGKWLAYAVYDNDFNRDVWVVPVDGSRPPVNLSCHPNIDDNPAWSPDGRIIAFTARRQGGGGRHLFRLPAEGGRRGRRPRSGHAAGRGETPQGPVTARGRRRGAGEGEQRRRPVQRRRKTIEQGPRPLKPPPKVRIDFDHIADRIHQVSIPDMTEGRLWWSPDSTKLAFTAAPEGKTGVYTIAPPDNLAPELLSTRVGKSARWLALDNRIVWLSAGIPGSVSPGKDEMLYRFSVPQEVNVARKYAAAFDLCWRTMRNHYYDPRLNNRNWDDVRRKYAPMAQQATSADELATVVRLMLGELNGSHLGFHVSEGEPPAADSQHSAHLAPSEHPWTETTGRTSACASIAAIKGRAGRSTTSSPAAPPIT